MAIIAIGGAITRHRGIADSGWPPPYTSSPTSGTVILKSLGKPGVPLDSSILICGAATFDLPDDVINAVEIQSATLRLSNITVAFGYASSGLGDVQNIDYSHLRTISAEWLDDPFDLSPEAIYSADDTSGNVFSGFNLDDFVETPGSLVIIDELLFPLDNLETYLVGKPRVGFRFAVDGVPQQRQLPQADGSGFIEWEDETGVQFSAQLIIEYTPPDEEPPVILDAVGTIVLEGQVRQANAVILEAIGTIILDGIMELAAGVVDLDRVLDVEATIELYVELIGQMDLPPRQSTHHRARERRG